MEYTNNIDPFELGMVGIVFIGYIVGKVWMYYRIEDSTRSSLRNKTKKSKGLIKRGTEWE